MGNKTVTSTSKNRSAEANAAFEPWKKLLDEWVEEAEKLKKTGALVSWKDDERFNPPPGSSPEVQMRARAARDRIRQVLDRFFDNYSKHAPEDDPRAIWWRKLKNDMDPMRMHTRAAAATRRDLNAKEEKTNARVASNANRTFFSAGESFADGAMIELISGSSKPKLLLWNGRKAKAASRFKHGGCTYEAPELDPILGRAIRLPAGCRDYGSARALFDGIRKLFQHHLGLPESESGLIASFAISTWLADRLPTAPNLTISGPNEELGIDVLRLLSCVCRHPLMLAELTPGSFRSLPMQLSLTLLLDQPRLRPNMQRLLRASRYRGLHFPGSRGSVVNPYGPKAIFCGSDTAVDSLSRGAICISVAPSQSQSSALDEHAQSEIANDFQRRLLMYRLKNASKVGESRVDVSKFTFATRLLARTLARCFPEDSKLARDTVQLLQPQDEEVREQHFFDVDCAVIEVLLGMIHHRKQSAVRVDELAKDVNALLRSRGEILEYSAEEVGWTLRDLNIPRHTSSSGREVLLGRETSQSVHRLVQAYGLPCSQRIEAVCPDCNQAKAALSK